MDEINSKEIKKESLGCLPYAIGGASFIPLVGVPLGIIAIIWGIIKRKKGGIKLALLGAGGISFSIILYGTLFYKGFIEKGGVYDELKVKMAQTQLTDLVKQIEYYKIQNGKYPKDLSVFEPEEGKESFIFIYEPFIEFRDASSTPFYYELTNEGNKYLLFSRGPDRTPFTEDDIFPVLTDEEIMKIGYKKAENNS
jgi:hypothetical protein